MLIKSNFNDYYDYMAQYGIEEDYTYIRKTEILDDEVNLYFNTKDSKDIEFSRLRAESYCDIMEYTYNILNFNHNYNKYIKFRNITSDLLFTIKNYKYIYTKINKINIDYENIKINMFVINNKLYKVFIIDNNYFNNINDFLNCILENNKNKDINKINSFLSKIDEEFNNRDFSIINTELNSPIIQIKIEHDYKYNKPLYYTSSICDVEIIKNPKLIKYKDYLPESNIIWSELITWFSNKNNKEYNNSDNLTDIDRLEKHGFDKKNSFRNV